MHLGISCPKHTSLTSRTKETSSVVFMWLGFLFLVHQTSTNLCRVCILHTWDQRPNAFWVENVIFKNVSWGWGTCGETLKLDINMHVWPVQNERIPASCAPGSRLIRQGGHECEQRDRSAGRISVFIREALWFNRFTEGGVMYWNQEKKAGKALETLALGFL